MLDLNHGKLWRDGKYWVVDCAAHVRTRLKRVFARIDSRQYDQIKLADSPETCRELLWFIQRYPLDLSDDDCAYLNDQSERHEREEQMVFEVVRGHVPPAEFDLALPLREYQRVATDLALKTGGLLIGDEVGTGKTAEAIGMLTDTRTLPSLVVTLTHLPKQWEREIHRFAPKLNTHIIKKGTPYNLDTKGPFPDVIICNYHKLAGWAEVLADLVNSVVWDECQELRRANRDDDNISQKGAAALHLAQHVGFRVGLSATPIYNHGAEMHNIMECIRPGALGPRHEFNNEWTMWGGEQIKDPKAFGTYLRDAGLMIRRTRADIGRELQPLTKVPHWIDADFDALDALASSADELALAIVDQAAMKQTDRFAVEREFEAKLRQATGVAKAPYVAEFVRMLVNRGEQVVLYGWHREVYSIWQERLADCTPVMYTGSESTKRKDESVQRFMEKEAKVLLISLRSGAGLDGLQHHCRTVVFGELDWSPGVHVQCTGRVHRDGQLDPVTAYYLMATSGADPFMAEVLGIKRAQAEGIHDPDGAESVLYDSTGKSIHELARDYLRQRRKAGAPADRASTCSLPQDQQLIGGGA